MLRQEPSRRRVVVPSSFSFNKKAPKRGLEGRHDPASFTLERAGEGPRGREPEFRHGLCSQAGGCQPGQAAPVMDQPGDGPYLQSRSRASRWSVHSQSAASNPPGATRSHTTG